MSFINDLLGKKPAGDSKITEEDKVAIDKVIKDLTDIVKDFTQVTDLVERLQQRKRIFEAIIKYPDVSVSIDTLNIKVTDLALNETKLYGLTGNDIVPGLIQVLRIAYEENNNTIEVLNKKILDFENNPTADNVNDLINFVKKEREK